MTKKLGFENDLTRQAGQSVDEKLRDFVLDTVDWYLTLGSLGGALIFFTWIFYFFGDTVNPWLMTAVGVLVVLFAGYKLHRSLPIISHLKQGREGERYVGQLLETLRSKGYVVFHDIVTDDFNIDHVVIGPTGIYVIETKTWSKGENGGEITYDESGFKLNGKLLKKNPVQQAQANARWLSNMLRKSTGKAFSVQPILTLPSWFIKPELTKTIKNEGVLLVNPKTIGSFLRGDADSLSSEDIHLSSYHLSLYIRSKMQSIEK